jgi:hypothetical protein
LLNPQCRLLFVSRTEGVLPPTLAITTDISSRARLGLGTCFLSVTSGSTGRSSGWG